MFSFKCFSTCFKRSHNSADNSINREVENIKQGMLKNLDIKFPIKISEIKHQMKSDITKLSSNVQRHNTEDLREEVKILLDEEMIEINGKVISRHRNYIEIGLSGGSENSSKIGFIYSNNSVFLSYVDNQEIQPLIPVGSEILVLHKIVLYISCFRITLRPSDNALSVSIRKKKGNEEDIARYNIDNEQAENKNLYFGRERNNNFILADETISKKEFLLTFNGKEWKVINSLHIQEDQSKARLWMVLLNTWKLENEGVFMFDSRKYKIQVS